MKVKAIIFVLLLTLLCLLFSSLVLRVAILIGELSESVLITPAFYKLLGRRYRNYEKYEVKEPN
ncbi:hypothetical protein OQI89_07975 [Lentilactobacillus diolivorans]|uniref:hypothetical protein n=1 Tax=Lentilactobacillus diolivorans TaxID=179838 RepID=UPI0024684A4E|nr:hypothetical protein [Lentilactobacillus diolivorans]MDH5105784.1 hypothetical protein [Lentilactobacillus diolivorans]